MWALNTPNGQTYFPMETLPCTPKSNQIRQKNKKKEIQQKVQRRRLAAFKIKTKSKQKNKK